MRIHIALTVESLADSVNFYARMLGAPASKQHPGYANFRLDSPPIHLALTEGAAVTPTASHFGIELPTHQDLDDWRQRLEAAGVVFQAEQRAACCYATADKLWLRDPDGQRWEIWVRTGDFDAMGVTRAAAQPEPAQVPLPD